MEACSSRLCVNIYNSVFRKIYIRPCRCLCTKKEDKSRSSDVSSNESDAKVNQNSSGDHTSPSNNKDESEKSGNDMQSDTHRFYKSSSVAEDASQGNQHEKTQTKLLSVLSDLRVNGKPTRNTFNFNLARPTRRLGKKKDVVKAQLEENKRLGYGEDMASAVKAVAASLGGDVEKTEQELVQSLISINKELETEESEDVKKRAELEDAKDESSVTENMMSAVGAVASSVIGDPEKAESELTKKLVSLADGTFKPIDLSDVVEGMKVEKKKLDEYARKLRAMQTRMHRTVKEFQIDLFNANPLNMFKLENKDAPQESSNLMLWDELQKKELLSLVQYAPSNPYEEMIQWTEQGKFWTFPINNEAGMHEEENVGFHEHVFLDHLLEGFPENLSVRLFMELVITGLSKNPYVSVQRKAEHVAWYREYFAKHIEILKQY